MLNKEQLKEKIKAAMLKNLKEPTDEQKQEITDLAGAIADGVDSYVRGIELTYVTGLAAPTGPVTGTFEYLIN